jgi:uroporphyrinogen-III synthase
MSQLISSSKSLPSENESDKTVACPGPRKKEKAREKGK